MSLFWLRKIWDLAPRSRESRHSLAAPPGLARPAVVGEGDRAEHPLNGSDSGPGLTSISQPLGTGAVAHHGTPNGAGGALWARVWPRANGIGVTDARSRYLPSVGTVMRWGARYWETMH